MPVACDFCRLPLPTGSIAPPDEPAYCCYGCQLAAQITRARGEAGQVNWALTRLGLSAFLTMTVMMFSMYLYRQQFGDGGTPTPIASGLASLMRYLSLLFGTPVFLMLAPPIFSAAWQRMRRGELATDALIVVGVGAAFAYSYINTLRDAGGTYVETGCAVLVFMTLGRWLEAQAKLKASRAARSLVGLFPDTVEVQRGDERVRVRHDDVRAGDALLVPAGQRAAADGMILSGSAQMDESLVTGESAPVVREAGDAVRAGSLNLDGFLRIRVTAVAGDSTLGRLASLLDAARQSRSSIERLTDRIARLFTPLVFALAAAAVVAGWRRGGPAEALMSALAVLLIACPCALGLATPMAVWTAIGAAARRGVLFRDGETVERLAGIRAVLFDKTGTLTRGEPAVVGRCCDPTDTESLRLAGRLAAVSTHPAARAIARLAQHDRMRSSSSDGGSGGGAGSAAGAADLADVRTIPGRGVCAVLPDGRSVALGSMRFMHERGYAFDSDAVRAEMDRAAAAGDPLVCMGVAGSVRAVFELSESLRPAAAEALAALRGAGLRVQVLTGDHARRGAALASSLGVEVLAECLPADKVAAVERVRRESGSVAMVGDGLNDAPALAAADVGMALACGADVSRDAAHVCLLGDDLATLPWLFRLARRTMSTVRVNLFWAFIYNVVGIGLALCGLLSPVFAAAAMVASSTIVVVNSLRLGR